MDYQKVCSQIVELDENVRFAGILGKDGRLKGEKYNKNRKMLLSESEAKMSMHYAFDRWEKRKHLSHKIGNERYSMTLYDKVKQFSIPLNDNELLLISTEPEFKHDLFLSQVLELLDK